MSSAPNAPNSRPSCITMASRPARRSTASSSGRSGSTVTERSKGSVASRTGRSGSFEPTVLEDLQRDRADQPPVLRNREVAAGRGPKIRIQRVGQTHPRRHDLVHRPHRLGDPALSEASTKRHPLFGPSPEGDHLEPDEQHRQRPPAVAAERQEPPRHQRDADAETDVAGHPLRRAAAAGETSHRRGQRVAAVERHRGDRVHAREKQVEVGELVDDERGLARRHPSRQIQQQGDRQRRERPHDGHDELAECSLGARRRLRVATPEDEGDAENRRPNPRATSACAPSCTATPPKNRATARAASAITSPFGRELLASPT